MAFGLKFMGRNKVDNSYSDNYKLNKTNIVVSKGDFSFELDKNVDADKEVLIVSFSAKQNKNMIPQDEIDYTLRHFGLDVSKRYYSWNKQAHDFIDNTYFNVLYFEQINDK